MMKEIRVEIYGMSVKCWRKEKKKDIINNFRPKSK